MKKYLTLLLLSIIFISCKKSETNLVDVNLPLFERLDGNYSIVYANSTEPYDINRDGISTTNLLNEIPNLNNSTIDIIVKQKSKYFRLMWSDQQAGYENEPQGAVYNYNVTGQYYKFEVDEGLQNILIDKDSPIIKAEFAPPISIDISNKENIIVVIVKTIMTASGSKEVKIKALYKRNADYKGYFN